jgi:hypothetical protein
MSEGVAEVTWGGRARGGGVGRELGTAFFFAFWPFCGKFITSKPFSVSIQKMDPYLGTITIGAEVARLDTNINGTKVSLRSADVAPTWQGSAASLLVPTPAARKWPLGPCVRALVALLIMADV